VVVVTVVGLGDTWPGDTGEWDGAGVDRWRSPPSIVTAPSDLCATQTKQSHVRCVVVDVPESPYLYCTTAPFWHQIPRKEVACVVRPSRGEAFDSFEPLYETVHSNGRQSQSCDPHEMERWSQWFWNESEDASAGNVILTSISTRNAIATRTAWYHS